MWGVYRFKRGFGGEVIRTIGAWDYPVKPLVYKVYTRLLPMMLNALRKIGHSKIESVAVEGRNL